MQYKLHCVLTLTCPRRFRRFIRLLCRRFANTGSTVPMRCPSDSLMGHSASVCASIGIGESLTASPSQTTGRTGQLAQLVLEFIDDHFCHLQPLSPAVEREAQKLAIPGSIHTPALTMRRISRSNATSGTCLASRCISLSWLTRSKKLSKSRSTT